MRKLFSAIVLVALLVVNAGAQILNPQAPIPNDPSVVTGKLENGLTYYIKHNEKPAQRADFYIVSNVGAIQQDSTQGGLAHFLEHMCFNGLKDFPGKTMFTYLEGIGAKFGANINAGTGIDRTSYMLNNIPVTRTGIIDSCLLILQNYGAYVINDPKDIDEERGVILEEKRTRNTSDWRAAEFEYAHLCKGSKYETALPELIGSEEQLKTFTAQTLVDYYHTWYRPDLQAIVVVGDVDVNYVENKIKETFSSLPARENPKPKDVIVVPGNEKPIVGVFTDKELQACNISFYFKQTPMPKEMRGMGMIMLIDLYKDVIASVLNERFQDIYTKPDAPFLNAYAYFRSPVASLDVFAVVVIPKEDNVEGGFQAAVNEIEKLKRYGITMAEFERAKSDILKGYERRAENEAGRENGQIVYDYISAFCDGYAYPAPSKEYEIAKGYFDAGLVSAPATNQVIAQMIDYKDNVIVGSFPLKEGLVVPTEAALANAIELAKVAEIAQPVEENVNEPLVDAAALAGSAVASVADDKFNTQKITLENGIEIYLKKTDFKKDEVRFDIELEGGQTLLADDLLYPWAQELGGLFTGYAGVSKFSTAALQKALAGKAANVSPYVNKIYHGVSGSGSPKDFETMMQLAYLYFVQPRFNADEINVGVNMVKEMLPNILKDPNNAAGIEFQKVLYGGNPRRVVIGENIFDKATVENFEKSYKQLFGNAKGAKVYIVGNVELEQIRPMLEKYIGSLPMGAEATKKVDNIAYPVKGGVEKVFEFPMTTAKTQVILTYSGDMERTLGNSVVASALENILDLTYVKTIREEEGGTYGVGTAVQVSAQLKPTVMVYMQFDTDPAKADKLIARTIEGFEEIATKGVCQEYIDKTRETMLKSYPENQIKNGYWMGVMSNWFAEGYDVDSDYVKCVNELVNSDAIKAFAAKVLEQKNFVKFTMVPKAE